MRTLPALMLAFCAGCAAQKAQQPPAAQVAYSTPGQPKPKGVLRCHMERDTGSNYAERVCTYDEPENEDNTAILETIRRASQRAAQHVQPPNP